MPPGFETRDNGFDGTVCGTIKPRLRIVGRNALVRSQRTIDAA
jgi:hypothetical protein